MIYGYDLDGTLCTKIPAPPKKWGLMKGPERNAWKQTLLHEYIKAQKLIEVPDGRNFHVISARKNNDDVVMVTLNWLHTHYPKRFISVNLLNDSRNIENVVNFKSATILEKGITWFVEDNLKVVKGLRATLGDRCAVIYYNESGELIE